MKILFTGGSTGGHFYPIIAVAQALREKVEEQKLLRPQFYYSGPTKYDPKALFDNELQFVYLPAGKIRRYFSLLNISDALKTVSGCLLAILKIYSVFPDVVFGKGGYASFPTLFAAKFLGIPVIIHESDSKPGRVNAWAGKFAAKIAVSYPDAAKYFKTDPAKIAYTGNPIRKEITIPSSNGAEEFFGLEKSVPVVLILGGSQGAQTINDTIVNGLPELLDRYQVIHQTGKANLSEIKQTTSEILRNHIHKNRYHAFDFLNEISMRMAAGIANVIVTRAGSTIFEIAAWGKPSIIIPLPTSVSHDQTTNARSYSRTGAASMIEENNLSAHVLIAEINRIVESPQIQEIMIRQAKAFSRIDAADLIAGAILEIAVTHEQ